MMNPVLDSVLAILLAIGTFFLLVASLGLHRFREFSIRAQTIKLAAMLGIPLLALASWIYFFMLEQQAGVMEPLLVAAATSTLLLPSMRKI